MNSRLQMGIFLQYSRLAIKTRVTRLMQQSKENSFVFSLLIFMHLHVFEYCLTNLRERLDISPHLDLLLFIVRLNVI